jgi:hypothetical protein
MSADRSRCVIRRATHRDVQRILACLGASFEPYRVGAVVLCLLACGQAGTSQGPPDTGEPDAGVPPTTSWARTYGGEGVDSAESVLELPDGYIVGGRSGFEYPVLSARFSALVLRLERDGSVRWQKLYGSLDDRFDAERVFPAGDGFFVGGSCSPENFRNCVLGLDGDGRIMWQRSCWGGWDGGHFAFRCFFGDVTPMSSGGYALVSLFDEAPGGLHVIRTDDTGHIAWQNSLAYGPLFGPGFVQETPAGGLLVLGSGSEEFGSPELVTVSDLDSAGTLLGSYGCRNTDVERTSNPVAARATSDGGLVILANGWTAESSSFTCRALFMLRIDRLGEPAWLKAYEADGFLVAGSAQPSSSGGFVVAGSFLEVDPAGMVAWGRAYGGPEDDSLSAAVPTSDNGFIAGGWTKSLGAGDKDVWVLKLDGDGALESGGCAGLIHELRVDAVDATPACQRILPTPQPGMSLETDPACSVGDATLATADSCGG